MRVEGLETLDYLDNLMHRERFTEQADAITFDGEVLCFIFFYCQFEFESFAGRILIEISSHRMNCDFI